MPESQLASRVACSAISNHYFLQEEKLAFGEKGPTDLHRRMINLLRAHSEGLTEKELMEQLQVSADGLKQFRRHRQELYNWYRIESVLKGWVKAYRYIGEREVPLNAQVNETTVLSAFRQPRLFDCPYEGKRCYKTKAEALFVARNRMAEDDGPSGLRTYRCEYCSFWHLTSRPTGWRRQQSG
jgi:hypothetical protein